MDPTVTAAGQAAPADSGPLAASRAYVLPNPPRPHGELLVGEGKPLFTARLREGEAVQRLANRWRTLLECQDRFFLELRTTLDEMHEEVRDEPRARLETQIRSLGEVLGWCEAIQIDLAADLARAAAGWQPLDVAAICREVASEATFAVVPSVLGAVRRPWWGSAALLARTLGLGLELAAQRSGGGAVAVELGEHDGLQDVRIAGHGEPTAEIDADLAARFREAADAIGARVVPDTNGPGGAGFVLRLPVDATPAPAF